MLRPDARQDQPARFKETIGSYVKRTSGEIAKVKTERCPSRPERLGQPTGPHRERLLLCGVGYQTASAVTVAREGRDQIARNLCTPCGHITCRCGDNWQLLGSARWLSPIKNLRL
jgi:hypothetical protein